MEQCYGTSHSESGQQQEKEPVLNKIARELLPSRGGRWEPLQEKSKPLSTLHEQTPKCI